MKRYIQLWKDTWWLWLIYFGLATLLLIFVTKIFVAVYIVLICVFVYFAIMRYDEEGQPRL